MIEPCTKGDECTKFCMADLSTKLFEIISKFKHASKGESYEKMERAREKPAAFEVKLDDACAYHKGHARKKQRSCSNKGRIVDCKDHVRNCKRNMRMSLRVNQARMKMMSGDTQWEC